MGGKGKPCIDGAFPPLRRGGERHRIMTSARLGIDEAQAFLDRNPAAQWIDAFLFDMNGIPRGKRIRRSDLLGVVKSGLMMPTSVFIMDPLGNCVEETGRLWETGDPDHQCHLLSGTLVPIPVGDGRHAQAVMVVDVKDELDPRTVLAGQVERCTRAGQTPVAAVELEFYVTRRGIKGAFVLHTPEGLSDDPSRPLTFGFEEMDRLSPFIDDIYRICEFQGLPVDAVMKESGPGQFEINLKENADAVGAALDGLLLKRAVKAAARAHQLEATFMAKPHHDWAGSGMHIHLSLLDKSGQNLFAGDPISPLFLHALGGMRETMADFMAVWAQSANAYRRYVPKAYVSMAAHWGFNNRTVALRIPRGNGTATRIEHRVAGADANPYLVIASILAGMSYGINNSIDPGPAVEGNSETIDAPSLPTAWVNSLDLFQRSEIVRGAFGAPFQDVFSRLKHAERSNFERIVTPLDHLWYARVA
jgi:glutamine synthetase